MQWFIAATTLFIGLFGFVLLRGAPYLPTLSREAEQALDLLHLKKGQRLLELGCGDGRVLSAALRRGLDVTGYELNPLLWFIAWARTRRYGRRAHVVCGDFWLATWPPTDGIFVFLLAKYMGKLDKKIVQSGQGNVRLVSYAFQIPGRKPAKRQGALFLYEYD